MCWSYIDTLVSGSPIIQDGKLVGAVTHVLVNDPQTGYGIFIENMREVAKRSFDGGREKSFTVLSPQLRYRSAAPSSEGALGGYHSYTHVLVNDPTTGYGIFIENMMEAAA